MRLTTGRSAPRLGSSVKVIEVGTGKEFVGWVCMLKPGGDVVVDFGKMRVKFEKPVGPIPWSATFGGARYRLVI